jgi:hypothetical protein
VSRQQIAKTTPVSRFTTFSSAQAATGINVSNGKYEEDYREAEKK